jgi:hypothetical protein
MRVFYEVLFNSDVRAEKYRRKNTKNTSTLFFLYAKLVYCLDLYWLFALTARLTTQSAVVIKLADEVAMISALGNILAVLSTSELEEFGNDCSYY